MRVIYKDENGELTIGEIITNRSMTVGEALEILGIDLDKWADEQGWDGVDPDCVELIY